jgi:hypothetical protein
VLGSRKPEHTVQVSCDTTIPTEGKISTSFLKFLF